jgi:vacuolar-type H+-ATPase subunit I/STV1
MNKRQIIAKLSKIANDLDDIGMHEEADSTTEVMKKIDRSSPIYSVETDDYDLIEIQNDTLDQILRLLDNIMSIVHNHSLATSKLGYLPDEKDEMLDAFVNQVISKLENIDFAGSISQTENASQGFLGKITSKFKRLTPNDSEDTDYVSAFHLSRIDKIINKIEQVCKKALMKINKIHNKLPFEDRIVEIQQKYIDMLRDKLSENFPKVLDRIYNLDQLKR